MHQDILTTDELGQWYDYYDRLPETGPYHDPAYLALLEGNFEFDTETVELFILEDGESLVYYPYFRRPLTTTEFESDEYNLSKLSDIVSSWYYGGPLYAGPDSEREQLASSFAEQFGDTCRERGIVAEFIRFDPNIRNDQTFETLEPDFNRKTVPVDLSKSRETIWEGFSSSNRTHIRQGRDAGFNVDPATTTDEIGSFHDIYAAAMDAKGASQHYRFTQSFFEDLVFGAGNGTLLVSRYKGDIVGGSLLVEEDETVCEFLRASEPNLWDKGLNNHLCYRAIVYWDEQGADRLDFQGGRPGVFKFKKAFSPERGEMYLARRVHDEALYENLVATAENAGINTESGYFPAYRVDQSN
jgi:hypothetical protein